MPRTSLTRRRVLQAGAAAVALSALNGRAPAALARPRARSFEMDLSGAESRAVAAAASAWRVLPVMRAPARFDLMGLAWNGARTVRAQVRARTARGRWTPWTPLPVHADHAPDGRRPPNGTEPCWTDTADFFQVRLIGDAPGLRARFVRARPSAELARRAGARPRNRRRARAARARASQAGTPPRIFSRTEWGGDSCPPRTGPSYGEVQLAFVHHTVSANDHTPEESAAMVLAICRYHRDHNRWNDLGYNFVVDRYGQIFEGRAGGIEQAVIGAQTQGYNRLSTGIACLGTFSDVAQTEAGMDALARLIGWKLSLHGMPVQGQVTVTSGGGSENRYDYGSAVTFERVSGHRDGGRTACPGDALYAQLPALRERAAAYAFPVSSLSAFAARSRVRHPSQVLLSGALRFANGASTAGKPIEVQFQAAGAAWTLVTQAQTGPDGLWSAQVSPPSSGMFRAVFPGDGTHPPVEGSIVAVEVLPRLTMTLEERRVAAGTRVPVRGTLGPNWPQRIELLLERRAGRRWVRQQRKRINVRGGRFATVVRPPRPGLYRISLSTPDTRVKRLLRALEVTGGASAR